MASNVGISRHTLALNQLLSSYIVYIHKLSAICAHCTVQALFIFGDKSTFLLIGFFFACHRIQFLWHSRCYGSTRKYHPPLNEWAQTPRDNCNGSFHNTNVVRSGNSTSNCAEKKKRLKMTKLEDESFDSDNVAWNYFISHAEIMIMRIIMTIHPFALVPWIP